MISPTKINSSNPLNSGSSAAQSTVKPETSEKAASTLKTWTAGEVVKASVLQQLTNGSLLLKIGDTKLSAQINADTNANLKLPVGAEVQLKVVQTGTQPLLQLIATARSSQDINMAALRQAIPKQEPLSNFFKNLNQLNANDQRLPQLVQQAVQSLQAGLTTRMDLLNPEGIKKALAESGTFLEANLSKPVTPNSSNPAQGDLKAQLLRLAMQLSNESLQQKQNLDKNQLQSLLAENKTFPDLLRHVESALARVQLNQLNSLPNQEQSNQAFLLDLPVKEKEQIDVFSLKVQDEENKQGGSEEDKRWSIKLSFQLNGLGQLHAKLMLGGEKIQASLWAEEETTFTLLENNIGSLKERLVDVDFIDPDVKCYPGKPESDHDSEPEYSELIDVKI